MSTLTESYISRIKTIIDRNMTPSGPNFDAEALLWALTEIERLKTPQAARGPVLATSSTELDFT